MDCNSLKASIKCVLVEGKSSHSIIWLSIKDNYENMLSFSKTTTTLTTRFEKLSTDCAVDAIPSLT